MRRMSNGFAWHLRRYGPTCSYPALTRLEAQSYCSRLARTHYENFAVASFLLPRKLLHHFHNVYAYCRWADDLADETGGGREALALLRWWREQLSTCYDGVPRHPVMIALKETIQLFLIPQQPFLDLLFAFEQDQLVKRYASFEQLSAYCRYSANPVGRLVLYLCDAFNAENAGLSDHVCTALQLANFWQDVARDFDIGRVYLPEEDLARFGYTIAELHARQYTESFVNLMNFEVERTRDMFYRGLPLLDKVSVELRPDIELFIRGGLAILRKIERMRYNVWRTRPKLRPWEKGTLLFNALWGRLKTHVLEFNSSDKDDNCWDAHDHSAGTLVRILRMPGAT